MEKPSSDEKTLAALAHASIIISVFGPIGPALIWVNQRNKSKYVRYHALQAMGYQVFSFWAFLIGMFLFFFGFMALTIVMGVLSGDNLNTTFLPFIIQPLIFLGIMGLMGFFFVYGIAGAVFCMMDRDFSYPFISTWLKKKLFNESVTDAEFEKWEDSWISGICHATTIIRLFGLIVPLIFWFTQKERSLKLRLHSLQAIFYQGIAVLVGILSYMVMMAFYIVFLVTIAIIGIPAGDTAGSTNIPPAIGLILFLSIIVMVLFAFATIFIVPLYYLLSAVAGISTIRGNDFKYPILGRIIANRIAASTYPKEGQP